MTLFIVVFLLSYFTFTLSKLFPFLATRPKLVWAITLLYPVKCCIGLFLLHNEIVATNFLNTDFYFSDSAEYAILPHVGQEYGLPRLIQAVTDPAFPRLLYYVVGIFRQFGVFNVTHELLLMFHIFLSHLLFPLLAQVLFSLFKKPKIAVFGLILAVLDLNFLVFGCMLLRETETAIIYLLLGWAFLKNRWLQVIFYLAVLYYFRSDAGRLAALCVLAWGLFHPFILRYTRLAFVLTFVGLLVIIQIAHSLFPILEMMLFGHLDLTIESGLGSILLHLPVTLRFTAYSLLGLVGRIPSFSLFPSGFAGIFYPFILIGLSHVTYFAFHLILFQGFWMSSTSESQYRTVFIKLYFIIFCHHLLFIGLISNYRHRVQFLPLMIIGLHYVWIMAKEKNWTLKTFYCSRAMSISVFSILILNILYVFIKTNSTL